MANTIINLAYIDHPFVQLLKKIHGGAFVIHESTNTIKGQIIGLRSKMPSGYHYTLFVYHPDDKDKVRAELQKSGIVIIEATELWAAEKDYLLSRGPK